MTKHSGSETYEDNKQMPEALIGKDTPPDDGSDGFEEKIHDALLQVTAPKEAIESTLDMLKSKQKPKGAHKRYRIRGFAIAACFLLIAVGGAFGFYTYQQPAAYIGIDVNPSIELTVNCFDRVVNAKALNEDGAQVLAEVNPKGKTYSAAFDLLMNSDAMSQYISNDSLIDVSVFSEDESLAQSLQEQSNNVLITLPCQSEYCEVSQEMRDAAMSMNLGMGRYRLASELSELDNSVSISDCRHMTMRQIRNRIDECRHADTAPTDAYNGEADRGSEGNGQGSGYNNSNGYGAHNNNNHYSHNGNPGNSYGHSTDNGYSNANNANSDGGSGGDGSGGDGGSSNSGLTNGAGGGQGSGNGNGGGSGSGQGNGGGNGQGNGHHQEGGSNHSPGHGQHRG